MRVHDIEQNSPEWLSLRAGMPTASAFSKIVSGTGKPSESLTEYARQLGIEKYKGSQSSNFGGNYHTRRGHELEPLAVEEYELTNGVVAVAVGFVTNDEASMGASPDRLINDDGVLEIKSLSDDEHYKVLEYYDSKQDIPPKYKPQLQGEILVCERAWADIEFYHPELPSLVHRVWPDELYREKLKRGINQCLKERDRVCEFLRAFGQPIEVEPREPKSKLSIEI